MAAASAVAADLGHFPHLDDSELCFAPRHAQHTRLARRQPLARNAPRRSRLLAVCRRVDRRRRCAWRAPSNSRSFLDARRLIDYFAFCVLQQVALQSMTMNRLL